MAQAGAVPASGRAMRRTIGVTDFYRVEGEEVHEVAVGPVHAGVIEPGHFRFQCHGEHVFHLEISLGYQHRGVERALVGRRTSADSTTWRRSPATRRSATRPPTASSSRRWPSGACPRARQALRGDRARARTPGEPHRRPRRAGGRRRLPADRAVLRAPPRRLPEPDGAAVRQSLRPRPRAARRRRLRPRRRARSAACAARCETALRDVTQAADLLWDTPSVHGALRGHRAALARSGRRARPGRPGRARLRARARRPHDHPTGIYRVRPDSGRRPGTRATSSRAPTCAGSRSNARPSSSASSSSSLPGGRAARDLRAARSPSWLCVSLVEGWRGEICHVALTDAAGDFARYKVVDPSFHNWIGLALALRDQQISDFPLCNKSFNLSYCGHDL